MPAAHENAIKGEVPRRAPSVLCIRSVGTWGNMMKYGKCKGIREIWEEIREACAHRRVAYSVAIV
jgi:hypothetical protein